MGNSNYSGGRYWDNSEAASIPAATVALSDSIRDQVLGKFTTTGARDTALAALPSTERAGCLAHVAEVGWSGYDGAAWRTVPMRGYTYEHGLANVVTSTDGLFSIGHALGTVNISAQLTLVYAGPAGAAEDVAMRTKLVVREFQIAAVVCWATDVSVSSPIRNAALLVSYRFEKL